MNENLSKALVGAQSAIQAVAKESTNTFHKFKYASSEDVIEEGRKALNTNGLALTASSWTFEGNAPESNPIGRVNVQYILSHSSGETREWTSSTPVVVDKGRPADKSEFSALTENLAYTLRGLLLIPRQNAEDISGRDDREYQPKKKETVVKPAKQEAANNEAIEAALAKIRDAADKASLEALTIQFKQLSASERTEITPAYKARLAQLSNGAS